MYLLTTNLQILLTKGLSSKTFQASISKLGMENIYSPTSESVEEWN